MNGKVLLVDDEPFVLNACKRQLDRFFEIETAEGARQAMELMAKRGPFAVVVCDMGMPGMNGIEFLAWVRDRWPGTVRMMLTGYPQPLPQGEESDTGGIFRFLDKPTPPAVLIEAIRSGIRKYQKCRNETSEETERGKR